jgi:hypothetical protein
MKYNGRSKKLWKPTDKRGDSSGRHLAMVLPNAAKSQNGDESSIKDDEDKN